MTTETSERPIVIVAGPTASGKSALALALAQRCAGTIINTDSQQVYRDLSILTARPSAAEIAHAPHRLYGIIDAAENCSVGRWLALAEAEIAAAQGEGRLPILVGGTGLYLDALLNGLAVLPPIPPEARAEAKALHAALGGAAFHARLAALDPVTAARLAPSDAQRLTRAYEVVRATGRPLSAWQAQQAPPRARPALALILLPPREPLYAACDARVLRMMAEGAAEEVRALLARDLRPDLPVMKAVGVREIAALLRGEMRPGDTIAAMQQATRRYAKRQYTWFRARPAESVFLRRIVTTEQFSERDSAEIFAFIRQTGLTAEA